MHAGAQIRSTRWQATKVRTDSEARRHGQPPRPELAQPADVTGCSGIKPRPHAAARSAGTRAARNESLTACRDASTVSQFGGTATQAPRRRRRPADASPAGEKLGLSAVPD